METGISDEENTALFKAITKTHPELEYQDKTLVRKWIVEGGRDTINMVLSKKPENVEDAEIEAAINAIQVPKTISMTTAEHLNQYLHPTDPNLAKERLKFIKTGIRSFFEGTDKITRSIRKLGIQKTPNADSMQELMMEIFPIIMQEAMGNKNYKTITPSLNALVEGSDATIYDVVSKIIDDIFVDL